MPRPAATALSMEHFLMTTDALAKSEAAGQQAMEQEDLALAIAP